MVCWLEVSSFYIEVQRRCCDVFQQTEYATGRVNARKMTTKLSVDKHNVQMPMIVPVLGNTQYTKVVIIICLVRASVPKYVYIQKV